MNNNDEIIRFTGYSRIDIEYGNYNGKEKQKTIHDPDTLLYNAHAQTPPPAPRRGRTPLDPQAQKEHDEWMRAAERSYKGQLRKFNEQKAEHSHWILIRRTGAVFITALATLLVYAFIMEIFDSIDNINIFVLGVLIVLCTTVTILIQRCTKNEVQFRAEKKQNKEVLRQWYESFGFKQ